MDSKYYAPLVCARCNAEYREIDNLGRWDCAVHPIEYNSDARTVPTSRWTYARYHWDCCGRSLDRADRHYESLPPRGCLPADHMPGVGHYRWNDDTFPLLAAVPLDALAVARYQPKRASVVCTVESRSDERRVYTYRYYDGTEYRFTAESLGFSENRAAEQHVAGEFDDFVDDAPREDQFRPYCLVARVAPRQNDRRVPPSDTIACSGIH